MNKEKYAPSGDSLMAEVDSSLSHVAVHYTIPGMQEIYLQQVVHGVRKIGNLL